jgi:hypothetical protein
LCHGDDHHHVPSTLLHFRFHCRLFRLRAQTFSHASSLASQFHFLARISFSWSSSSTNTTMETTDAKRMLFCISGVQGLHSAHESITYYYRGHYIYATPGNPVVPLPFPTKGKLLVSGVTADCAPAYDRGDRSLVPVS